MAASEATAWTWCSTTAPCSRCPGGWWVSDFRLGSIRFLDDRGQIVFEELSIPFPVDVASPGDSTVWVASGLGPVARMALGRGVTALDTLAEPSVLAAAGFPDARALAGDPRSQGVWVAERSRRQVLLLDGDGTPIVTAGGFPG